MRASDERERIPYAADETAARLVAALGGGGLAAGFIRRYAEANRRRALLAHAAHYRELVERISREALLAMAAQTERLLARRFPPGEIHRVRKRAFVIPAGRENLANSFRVEFYGRLAERLDWDRQQLQDFWRDLDLYTGAAHRRRPRTSRRGAHPRKSKRRRGAFADRCAFLLDSSLLERARRAAAGLERELESRARRAVSSAFLHSGVRSVALRPHRRRRTSPRIARNRIRTKMWHSRRGRKKGGRR